MLIGNSSRIQYSLQKQGVVGVYNMSMFLMLNWREWSREGVGGEERGEKRREAGGRREVGGSESSLEF